VHGLVLRERGIPIKRRPVNGKKGEGFARLAGLLTKSQGRRKVKRDQKWGVPVNVGVKKRRRARTDAWKFVSKQQRREKTSMQVREQKGVWGVFAKGSVLKRKEETRQEGRP